MFLTFNKGMPCPVHFQPNPSRWTVPLRTHFQGAELDEILKRLALHEGVQGTIVVNGEG
jgi:hypothetical protein